MMTKLHAIKSNWGLNHVMTLDSHLEVEAVQERESASVPVLHHGIAQSEAPTGVAHEPVG
eukprot:11609336-Alexandrium_andersonii.AAC.1